MTPQYLNPVFLILELGIWIEEAVGSQLDLTKINLREEWDTVASILNFIDKQNGS